MNEDDFLYDMGKSREAGESFDQLRYRLSDDIPDELKKQFIDASHHYSKLFPLANLSEDEKFVVAIWSDIALQCAHHGLYDLSRTFLIRMKRVLQSSRGDHGFETIMQSGAYKRSQSEIIRNELMAKDRQRQGISGRLRRMLSDKDDREEEKNKYDISGEY